MTAFFTIIKLIITILPLIIDLIKALESALPQAGLGSDKLSVVRTVFESAYSVADETLPEIEKTWGIVQKVINAVVALFNKTGEFTK